jgi:hypothetical protein
MNAKGDVRKVGNCRVISLDRPLHIGLRGLTTYAHLGLLALINIGCNATF